MSELAYLGAGVLFILGLKRLTSPRTARKGNQLAALGMLLATIVVVVVLLLLPDTGSVVVLAIDAVLLMAPAARAASTVTVSVSTVGVAPLAMLPRSQVTVPPDSLLLTPPVEPT